MTESTPLLPLTLRPLSGPPLTPIRLAGVRSAMIGRAAACDARLVDEAVSRRHASVSQRGGVWLLADEGSRHGTLLNEMRLEPHRPAPLADGDRVTIMPWTFEVLTGAPQAGVGSEGGTRATGREATVADEGMTTRRVETVDEAEVASLARHRLALLMECAASIHSATDERSLAERVLSAVLSGTGYSRAAYVHWSGGGGSGSGAGGAGGVGAENSVEVLARMTAPGMGTWARDGAFPISRSLLRAASAGRPVRLTDEAATRDAQSVIESGVEAAMCAPIEVTGGGGGGSPSVGEAGGRPAPPLAGAAVSAYIYLDAAPGLPGPRGGALAGGVQADAGAFCAAIARMCGLALSSIRRQELEGRQRVLEADLQAAREAQERIMPPPSGTVGPVRYAVRSRPGRMVAGDLFGVFPIRGSGGGEGGAEGGRTGVFLGDVMGKGMGAAILMAAVQAELRAALRVHGDPAAAASEVNRWVASTSKAGEFLSLWIGVFEPNGTGGGRVRYVDAGHGYWLVCPGRGGVAAGEPSPPPRRVVCDGGLVLGVDPDHVYRAEELDLEPGDRLVVFSDGIPEQRSPSGEHYDLPRVVETLSGPPPGGTAGGGGGPEEDVASLFEAVLRFAATDALTDDVTVGSVQWVGGGEPKPAGHAQSGANRGQ